MFALATTKSTEKLASRICWKNSPIYPRSESGTVRMNFNLKLKYFSRNQVVKNIKKIDCSAGSERSKKDRGINVTGSYSPLYKRRSYWGRNVSRSGLWDRYCMGKCWSAIGRLSFSVPESPRSPSESYLYSVFVVNYPVTIKENYCTSNLLGYGWILLARPFK